MRRHPKGEVEMKGKKQGYNFSCYNFIRRKKRIALKTTLSTLLRLQLGCIRNEIVLKWFAPEILKSLNLKRIKLLFFF